MSLRQPFSKRFLRAVLLSIKTSEVYRRIFQRPGTREELHRYWREPWDGQNLPEDYLHGKQRSEFLHGIVRRHASPDARILEIGCGVGRNLDWLFRHGFHHLEGIEISRNAVRLLEETFPEMAAVARIRNVALEEIIEEFGDREFDVVFSMAVLEHIHSESEWTFSEIARITRKILITIEDESTLWWRHFPRNYKKVFEALGMAQIEEIDCSSVEGLGNAFHARIFSRDGKLQSRRPGHALENERSGSGKV